MLSRQLIKVKKIVNGRLSRSQEHAAQGWLEWWSTLHAVSIQCQLYVRANGQLQQNKGQTGGSPSKRPDATYTAIRIIRDGQTTAQQIIYMYSVTKLSVTQGKLCFKVVTKRASLNRADLLTNVIETKKSSAKNVLTRRIFPVHPPINYKRNAKLEKLKFCCLYSLQNPFTAPAPITKSRKKKESK